MAFSPQKAMVFLFPLITFSLFAIAAIGWWVLTSNPWTLW